MTKERNRFESPQTGYRGRSGARLHAGIFSDHRPGGRLFQGIGFMVDRPGFQVVARRIKAEQHQLVWDLTSAPTEASPTEARLYIEHYEAKVKRVLDLMEQSFPEHQKQKLQLRIESVLPPHVGLGSGTQLALTIGRLWLAAQGIELLIPLLTTYLKRGRRSWLGTFGFERGGMLIDHGKTKAEQRGVCRFQNSIPEQWRFLLAIPEGIQGLAEQAEIEAFQQLPQLSEPALDRLEQILQQVERTPEDFHTVSHQIREFGLLVGDSFANIQGGRFQHPLCETIFAAGTKFGITGIAQSSWGPGMFLMCGNQTEAEACRQELSQIPGIALSIAKPRNAGVEVESIELPSD